MDKPNTKKEWDKLYKTHVEDTIESNFYFDGWPLSDAVSFLQEIIDFRKDWVDIKIESDWDEDIYGDTHTYNIRGWRPKTEKELAKEKTDCKRQREAKKAFKEKQRQDEIEQLHYLTSKYPEEI